MAGAYDPREKFTQPAEGIVLVKNGDALTDDDIAEARGRISAGESSMDVWADIDARLAARMLMRQDVEGQ